MIWEEQKKAGCSSSKKQSNLRNLLVPAASGKLDYRKKNSTSSTACGLQLQALTAEVSRRYAGLRTIQI